MAHDDRNLIIYHVDVSGGTNWGESASTLEDMYAWVDRITAQAYRRTLTEEEVLMFWAQ